MDIGEAAVIDEINAHEIRHLNWKRIFKEGMKRETRLSFRRFGKRKLTINEIKKRNLMQ